MDEFLIRKDSSITENTAMEADSDVLVDFNNVTFAYDDKNVVENLSFSIKKGEQVTLSGRTGAGKSTIFKLLLGLYEPDNGSVLIAGQKVTAIPDSGKRKIYGYVEQTFHMVPGTVKDQITLYDVSITDEDVIEELRQQVFMMQLWNLTMDMILYASRKISHRDSGSYYQLQGLQQQSLNCLCWMR